MNSRPTIALAMIVKNEVHNLSSLLQSINGCFDEIHITDTGSTDQTVEVLKSDKAKELAGCPIFVHHFEWVNDFSKARQYSFDQVPKKIDYVAWIDGDDLLSDKEAFIHFRDHSMHCCHQWLVPYNYAYDLNGKPICTFYRERIVKNNYGFSWKYFVHEGLIPDPKRKVTTQYVQTFTVNHKRTELDEKQDKLRNLKLFKDKENELCERMLYYYGKELFEAGEYLQSSSVLHEVCKLDPDRLQMHDRVMAMQYLSGAFAQCNKWEESLKVALLGLNICPERAEFWVLAGDANLRLNRVSQSILFYEAARKCPHQNLGGMTYTSPHSYSDYPTHQLTQIYLSVGDVKNAEKEVERLKELKNPSYDKFKTELERIRSMCDVPDSKDLIECDDIVISCPPGGVTEGWDENTLKDKPTGGSETACIELARQLKLKTGRPVKVFHKREKSEVMESGVEYHPVDQLKNYFFRYKPHRHLAWRHASKITPSKSYVWSHDLVTQGGEFSENYDKYLCLTGFHKEFTKDMLKVPDDKISLVRNGIDPEHFLKHKDVVKNPNKIIFSSSPDRGLERCVNIVRKVKEKIPDVELHVFYGTENMRKMGMQDEANRLDNLLKEDFVRYHGFVSKDELLKHFKESSVWLYPADFIETSCISAMEAMCSGTFPVVRNMGALKYTLKEALDKDVCMMLDEDASCDEEYQLWADKIVEVIDKKLWEKMDISPYDYSWDKVSDDFIKVMEL